MPSRVVGGDECLEGGHDVMMVLRFGSKDREESRSIVNGDEGLSVASYRKCRKQL